VARRGRGVDCSRPCDSSIHARLALTKVTPCQLRQQDAADPILPKEVATGFTSGMEMKWLPEDHAHSSWLRLQDSGCNVSSDYSPETLIRRDSKRGSHWIWRSALPIAIRLTYEVVGQETIVVLSTSDHHVTTF